METILQGVKDVFTMMGALGWDLVPIICAAVVMMGLRVAYEPGIIETSTVENLKSRNKIKAIIIAVTFIITLMVQYGRQRPKDSFDIVLSIGFSLVNVGLAYVVTSLEQLKSIIRSKIINKEVGK